MKTNNLDVKEFMTKGLLAKEEEQPEEEKKPDEEKPKEEEKPTEEKPEEEKEKRILSKENRSLISIAIEQLKTISVALSELLNAAEPQGVEGEEHSEDGSALKQRSKDAGSDLGKTLDDWLFFRSVLRSVNNATSDALKVFNERNRKK